MNNPVNYKNKENVIRIKCNERYLEALRDSL